MFIHLQELSEQLLFSFYATIKITQIQSVVEGVDG